MSPVACKVCIAHERLRVCGETRFWQSEGCLALAVRTCLARMYLNPDLVMRSPRALWNSAALPPLGSPRTLSQSRSVVAVSLQRGGIRSRQQEKSRNDGRIGEISTASGNEDGGSGGRKPVTRTEVLL